MNPEMEALGRRWMACKGFRWMPGMSDGLWRCVEVDGDETRFVLKGRPDVWALREDLRDDSPDLTDPATLGCLLAQVREAYGCYVWTTPADDGDWWGVMVGTLPGVANWDYDGATEAEALISALEAA